MARKYRFFTRHITKDSFPADALKPFHLYENLEPEIFFQLVKVLRVKETDLIAFLPILQSAPYHEYLYEVESADKKEISLRFVKKTENLNEPEREITLVLCIPNKPDKLDFILQKSVELGVKNIVLVEGDFSQLKHNLRPERIEKVLIEAAEQSERAIVPKLLIAGSLREFLNKGADNLFVALERSDCKNLLEIMSDKKTDTRNMQILVGPEGGFSDEEKELFKRTGLTCFTLGKRILRVETAALLSLGMISIA
jgi:16S rRNA (uracil1498-N3)-methyltransferase